MMAKFRNLAGRRFRNETAATAQAIETMARVTGLEPATSGVTGRAVSPPFQQPFRKAHDRNDAGGFDRPDLRFGTPARVQRRLTQDHAVKGR